ncbi:hypothetical protein L1987_76346 [Smallanthus sonchifolius]|uniref:Uncharacterized protein n=1 Tax=Smallanthus sonchifolius TaxID=185202 RepID=A0ACB9A970_9ASTR|nr:hypothetical protein L1987_76346 [Smallanthus sonchifolius]
MQAIREKISDIRGARKVKSEAIHEQQQAELARVQAQEMAHEARLIREAEIAMGIHTEEYIQHEAKLQGDHKNTTGYGGNGLNNRHVLSPRGGYGGSTSRYSDGTYSASPGHNNRKMAIHHNAVRLEEEERCTDPTVASGIIEFTYFVLLSHNLLGSTPMVMKGSIVFGYDLSADELMRGVF